MAAVAPLRQRLLTGSSFTCSSCRRALSSSAPLASGHNKWSKIKHQKGAADNKRMLERAEWSSKIIRLSKLYGPDLAFNTQLANVVALAKKAGVPKASIESALARGQGISSSGAPLEPLTLEIMMPPSVALIVEAETDRKNHEMQNFTQLVKKHSGKLSSTLHLFTREGRVVLDRPREGDAAKRASDDAVMDVAIENGAEDVVFGHEDGEVDGDEVVVKTQPGQTTELVEALNKQFGLKAASVEVVWAPNEFTRAHVGKPEQFDQLIALVEGLREHSDVQAVYSNAEQGDLAEEEWARLAANLDGA